MKLKKQLESLRGLEIKIPANAGDKAAPGAKLFGSVTEYRSWRNALKEAGHEVDKKFISINGGNIKRLGQYEAAFS